MSDRASMMSAHSTWRAAVDEALRLRRVCQEKFGDRPHNWKYQVRKRWYRGHTLWRVYTSGRVSHRG